MHAHFRAKFCDASDPFEQIATLAGSAMATRPRAQFDLESIQGKETFNFFQWLDFCGRSRRRRGPGIRHFPRPFPVRKLARTIPGCRAMDGIRQQTCYRRQGQERQGRQSRDYGQ